MISVPELDDSVTSGKNCSRKPGCIANIMSAQVRGDSYETNPQSPGPAAEAFRGAGWLTIEMTPPVTPLSYLDTSISMPHYQECSVHVTKEI